MPKLGRRRSAAAIAALLAASAIAVALLVGGHASGLRHRSGGPAPGPPASGLPADPAALAGDIDRAQQVIDAASSTSPELSRAGRFEQLATLELENEPVGFRRATLARLGHEAAATIRANLSADAALSGLAAPPKTFPDWRIVQPPPPRTLLAYFRIAQSRFGVPWQDLAAVEFIETRFGRIQGLSSAGARGPMQFLPSTWAEYGSGRIDNQHDAILSAARYLAANGAPGAMSDALYHYNNSLGYVHAVEDYAARMRADARAYVGYYYWQVAYTRVGGTAILPLGYPKARPEPVHVP